MNKLKITILIVGVVLSINIYGQNEYKNAISFSPFGMGYIDSEYFNLGGGFNVNYEFRIAKFGLYAGYMTGAYKYEQLDMINRQIYNGNVTFGGPILGARYRFFEMGGYDMNVDLGFGFFKTKEDNRTNSEIDPILNADLGKTINHWRYSVGLGVFALFEKGDVSAPLSLGVSYLF